MIHVHRIIIIIAFGLGACRHDPPPPPPNGSGTGSGSAHTAPVGSGSAMSPPAGPDLTAIDRDIAAAIKRRHELTDTATKKADERQRQAEDAVQSSHLGTTADRAKILAAMKASWKNGHSPQGQAIIDTEAAVEDDVATKVKAAKAQPPEKQKALLEDLVQHFPQQAADATTKAAHQAGTDQLGQLLKAAAPVAVFAGCMALGGGPICGLVASVFSKLFGGKELIHTDDIVGVINDIEHVLSGDCDLSCVEEMALRVPLDDATLDKVATEIGNAIHKPDELKAIADTIKKRSREVKGVVECITDIGSASGGAEELVKRMTMSKKCGGAAKVFGTLDPRLVSCTRERKPVLAAACMYACRPGATEGERNDCDRLQVTRE